MRRVAQALTDYLRSSFLFLSIYSEQRVCRLL
jgi:hypothetical protein